MGLNLSSIIGKTSTTDVEIMGQSTKIVYDPSVITLETLSEAQAGTDKEFATFFAKLVKSWDVKAGTKTVPLTTAGLNTVPIFVLRAIFRAVMAEADSGASGKASSAG